MENSKNKISIGRIIFVFACLTLGSVLMYASWVGSNLGWFLLGGALLVSGVIWIVKRKKDSVNLFIYYTVLLILPALFGFGIILFNWRLFNNPLWFSDFDKGQWVDVFSGIIAYVGAVFLGLIAFEQNNKLSKMNYDLEKSNEQYRNLSVVPFLTFIHVSSLQGALHTVEDYNANYKKYVDLKIEFEPIDEKDKVQNYLFVSVNFKNPSAYPVTEISAHVTTSEIASYVTNSAKSTIYMGPKESCGILIIIPVNAQGTIWWNNLDKSHNKLMDLQIYNALGYPTLGNVYVTGKAEQGRINLYYETAQFQDISPFQAHVEE